MPIGQLGNGQEMVEKWPVQMLEKWPGKCLKNGQCKGLEIARKMLEKTASANIYGIVMISPMLE